MMQTDAYQMPLQLTRVPPESAGTPLGSTLGQALGSRQSSVR